MRRRLWLSLLTLPSITALAACSGDDAASTGATTMITGATLPTGSTADSDDSTSGASTTAATATMSGTASQGETTSASATDGTDSDPTATTGVVTDSDSDTATDTDATTGVVMCTEADCPMGQYCNPDSGSCEPGCNDDTDCQGETTFCDVDTHTCQGCLIDGDCPLGTVCTDGACAPGCNDNQPCQDGLACCGGGCVDPLVDLNHCGGCDIPCDAFPNADPLCEMGQCILGPCAGNFFNCDGDAGNGCENQGECACEPGSQIACYTGDEATKNVGICKEGVATCNAQGTEYGPCEGEVTPALDDICGNGLDDDCDGQADENPDADNDGWGVCDGDCCDSVGPNCLNPGLVNPGAFEVGNNMVDDDCDGVKDNPVPVCDNGLASNSNNPLDYAKAIDLCQFTTENPPKAQKKWGVISGSLTRANGAGAPAANAKSIRPGFGSNVAPQFGNRIAVFSTGNAADLNDTNPGYADFQVGLDNGANSAAPADWLAANGGQFPNAPGCPGAGSTQANNSVQLKLRIRVPTNAQSFNVQMFFYSAEWPEWACSAYNDMFVTLVDSQGANNPADKNIAIYKTQQNQLYPVGVNLVKAANGLFTQCKNGQYGCFGVAGNYNGCVGTNLLTGTGFDIIEGGCGTNNTTGGGTGWLQMNGNVKGGETMEIRFTIWDTADGVYDSLVLLDDWQWSVQASQPGVIPN